MCWLHWVLVVAWDQVPWLRIKPQALEVRKSEPMDHQEGPNNGADLWDLCPGHGIIPALTNVQVDITLTKAFTAKPSPVCN